MQSYRQKLSHIHLGSVPHKKKGKTKYRCGLSDEQYELLLSEQGGVCAICRNPPGEKKLAVDHNHESGRIRGLLCGQCNMGIGALKENPLIIKSACEYVEGNGVSPYRWYAHGY